MTRAVIPVIRRVAQLLAELVYQYVVPCEYHATHRCDGKRVEIVVRLFVSPEDTQPVRVAEPGEYED